MNKVELLGRLTKDPEVRYTQSTNTMVVSFSVAVNRRFKKEGEQEADFINCIAWSKTAEFISKYFKKGAPIGICGRLQTRSWEDNGKKHFATEVVVEEVDFAGSKPSGVEAPVDDDTMVADGSDLPF